MGHPRSVKGGTTIINLQDPVGKTVGRRRPPEDAFVLARGLQATLNRLLKEAGHGVARKGVFRFKTHEEADAWRLKMTSPGKTT